MKVVFGPALFILLFIQCKKDHARTTTTTWPSPFHTSNPKQQKADACSKTKMPSSQGCTDEEFGNDSGKEEYCTRNYAVCTKLCRCCAPCPDQSEEECGISGILTTRRPKQTKSRQISSTQRVSSPKTTDKTLISTSNYTMIRTYRRTKFSIPSASSQGLTAATTVVGTTHGSLSTEGRKNHSATYTAKTDVLLTTTAATAALKSKTSSTLIAIIVGVVVAVIIILAILTILLIKYRRRKPKRKQTNISNQYDVVLPLSSTVDDPGYEQINRSNVESPAYSYIDIDKCGNRPTNLGKIPPKKVTSSQTTPPYSYVDTNFIDKMILKSRTVNANNEDNIGNEPKYFELVCEDQGPCKHSADSKATRPELKAGQDSSPVYAELIPQNEGGKASVMLTPLGRKKMYASDQRLGPDGVSSPAYADVFPDLDKGAYEKNSSTDLRDGFLPCKPSDVPESPVYFDLAPEEGEGSLARALEQARSNESSYRKLPCAENTNQYPGLNVEDDDYKI